MALRLTLDDPAVALCTDPGDLMTVAPEVLDAHAVVVLYGGEAPRIAVDAQAEVPGLGPVVAGVEALAPEGVRASLDAEALDEAEAVAVAALDAVMLEALEPDAATRRKEALAGYVLVLIRARLRVEPPRKP